MIGARQKWDWDQWQKRANKIKPVVVLIRDEVHFVRQSNADSSPPKIPYCGADAATEEPLPEPTEDALSLAELEQENKRLRDDLRHLQSALAIRCRAVAAVSSSAQWQRDPVRRGAQGPIADARLSGAHFRLEFEATLPGGGLTAGAAPWGATYYNSRACVTRRIELALWSVSHAYPDPAGPGPARCQCSYSVE